MSAAIDLCNMFAPQPKPKVKRVKAKSMPPIEVALDDAKRRAKSGDWEGSKGATFIGLYALCHEMVYGVVPDELYEQQTFRAAAKFALKVLRDRFEDDADQCAAFMRWSWEREKRKHTWAQANGLDRNRLGWKLQFATTMLTDYRVALSQKKA